jgi:lipid-A-disaccharide synthase
MAASVLGVLGDGFHAWGVGGEGAAGAGLERVSETRSVTAMGILDVARRAAALATAAAAIVTRARRDPPRAALLVNFTEANARLGRWLRGRGVRVVWCGAPQVWAWRPWRARRLASAADAMAVLLPFEEGLWRAHGVDARFVGHPAAEAAADARAAAGARASARAALQLASGGPALAILPGSRKGEVERLATPLCEAAALLCRDGSVASARVLRAPGLSDGARARVAEVAARFAIPVVDVDARRGVASLLPAFEVALCASGTATLEAALAGAAPVVAYRLDALAWQIARRLVTTPHVALPNVVLGRRAFPELLQDEVTAERVAAAARQLLATVVAGGEARTIATTLQRRLVSPDGARFADRVAALLQDGSCESSRGRPA